MTSTITMDSAGRVVIPKVIRERFGLANGSHALEVIDSPEGIVLRPKMETVPVIRHASGWIVFQSGEAETVDPVQAVEEDRQARLRHIAGRE